ncbi:MAG: hypothetical protein ACOY30_05270 [Bacillota bacterium]
MEICLRYVSLLGTPYEIDTRGKTLFFEHNKDLLLADVHFMHLLNAGNFQEAAGIVLGQFVNCKIRPND